MMIGSCNSGTIHNGIAQLPDFKNDASKQKKFINLHKVHKNKLIGKSEDTQSDAFTVDKDEAPNKEADEKAKRETFRLASFRKCKIAVAPYDLAMAGFYYVGPGDRVRCYSCGRCVQSWKPKDKVGSERWHEPNCRHFFKKESNNISIGDTSTVSTPPVSTAAPLPTSNTKPRSEKKMVEYPSIPPPSYLSLQPHAPRQHPQQRFAPVDMKPGPSAPFSLPQSQGLHVAAVMFPSHQNLLRSLNLYREADRRQTFTSQWPPNLFHLIYPLARTGFFFLGNADRAQCIFCGAVQKNWLATDDVRKVHAECFGNCSMVRNVETRNIPLTEPHDVYYPHSSPSMPPLSRHNQAYSVPSHRHISASYYEPATPLTPPVQNMEFSDPLFRGPPAQQTPEAVESSQISRQISERSTDTGSTNSLLESVFLTPSFNTESGNLTLNLPVNTVEYPDTFIEPPSRASSSPHLSRLSTRQETPSPRHETLIGRERFSVTPEPPSITQETGFISQERPYASSSPYYPASTAAQSLGNLGTPHYLSSVPVLRSHSRAGHGSPMSVAAPYLNGIVTSLHPSSIIASPSEEFAARGNESTMTSSRASTLIPVLTPSTVSSLSPAPSRSPIQQPQLVPVSQPSSSRGAENWLRELDPFAAVISPPEPEVAELPRSELDVDDNYIEDLKMRFMLQEMYTCQDPANRSMVYLSQRTASFRQPWPEDRSMSSIPETAAAGFYYLGVSDHVCCWYCGVEAKDWACNRTAWDIHALLFPSCQYLLRNRGLGFVETVLSQVPPEPSSSAANPSFASYRSGSTGSLVGPSSLASYTGVIESGPDRLPTPPIVDPREEYEQKRMELRLAMRSEMVELAIGMGFTRNHVRQVLKKQIEQYSCAFQTSEGMVDALILTPEDLMAFDSDEEASQEYQAAVPTTSRQVGSLEELPDTLDLYQSGEPSLVSQPEEVRDVRNAHSAFQASAHQSLEANSGPTAPKSPRGEQLPNNEKDLKAELKRLQDEKRCKICLDKDACMVFLPCGHICACMDCTKKLKLCPLCRHRIDKAYRTY